MDRGKLIHFCDKTIEICLYVLIFCLPFSRAIIEICATTAIVMWVIKRLLGYRTNGLWRIFPSTYLNLPLFSFMLICIFSVIISSYFVLSLRAFIWKTAEYTLLFFIVIEVINDKRKIRNILITVLISAGIMGMDGGIQYFTHVELLRHRSLFKERVTGPFSSPNDFAAYLVVILPLILSLSFSELKSRRLRWLLKLESALLMVLLIIGISRGAWIGFVAALLFIGIFNGKRALLTILVTLVILFFILPPNFKGQIKSIFILNAPGGNMDRRLMWQGGWDMFLDKPILGHGLGTFMRNFMDYRPQGYEEIVYAHNCYLQIAAELGVIGLATFLWMIILLFDTSIRSLRKIEDKFYRAILLGLLGGLLAYLAHSAVDTNLYSLPLAVLFWFILGLTVSLSRLK